MRATAIGIICLVLPLMPIRAAGGPTTQAAIGLTINRSDLAAAYSRFEQAYQAHRPVDVSRARIHQAVDEAAVLYVSGRQGQGIELLNNLTDSLQSSASGPSTRPWGAQLVNSLQLRIAPPVVLSERPSVLRVRVAQMYPVAGVSPVDLRLIIRSDAADSKTVLDVPIHFDPKGPPATFMQAQPRAAIGKYLAELVGPDGTRSEPQHWSVVLAPLDTLRLANERRLNDLHPDSDSMWQSITACHARNALLSNRIDLNNPAQFLSDPLELSREVQSEVEWLSMGKDPYAGRIGYWWRAIHAGGMDIPACVYAPPQVKDAKAGSMPLLIGLSGALGDETTLMEYYGDGQIKTLADQRGFVVVTPGTRWVMHNPAALDSIIAAMSYVYPIDLSRVYLLGHGGSAGAMAATVLAARQPDKIAGMVLFAGGQFASIHKLPPTLVYQGQADSLNPPAPTQAAVEQARAAGLPVELRMIPGAGHTLIVNDQLPDAIQWLRDRRR